MTHQTGPGIELFDPEMAAYCGHCKLHVSMYEETTRQVFPKLRGPGANLSHDAAVFEKTMYCTYCDGGTLYLFQYDASDEVARPPAKVVLLYPAPAPRQLDDSVPEKVRSLFHEAALCETHGALRAAAVMYRGTVEEMCKDLGASGGNLYQRINGLAGLGLGRDVVDDMHEARLLGNDSIHDGLIYAADEVADVAELVEEALTALYVQPAQRQAYRQRRLARRQAGA
ncbi:DUF4145 domain-containing protein [Actinomadura oligospora]|uniref:DUF4145 domain-containing protein n=1 Tax=Actinomadura oligospora TaxID=111804 RepID=UPI001475E485|nr:DUF4145 domain-containing protein [Actinomadura oligospora]